MDCYGIRKARKAVGFTQEDLAAALGLNRATVSKYESGLISPTYEQLNKIALALNTTAAEMLGMSAGPVVDFDDELKTRLDAAFSLLNNKGKAVAVERIEELVKITDYQDEESPADSG